VVPILFYTAKREGEPEPLSYPAYLVAGSPKPGVLRKVFERRTKQNIRSPAAKELAVRNMKDLVRNAVHNNAAFYYHGEKIEPVCGACTRSLFMLAGECRFGEARCYKALSSIAPSDFIKNMRDYQTYVREAAELEDSHVELRGN
jgi:protein-arginine kinase activator protein McsA